jgi:hypothetical protein
MIKRTSGNETPYSALYAIWRALGCCTINAAP